MSALPHVTSSSLEESKVKKLAGKVFPSPKKLAKMETAAAVKKEAAQVRVSGSGVVVAAGGGNKGDVVASVEEEEDGDEAAGLTVQELYTYTQKHLLRVCESG